MGNKGTFLATKFLQTNDYLTDGNGLFFACLQGDGNLCVYRGRDPGDNIYGPALWCSMSQHAPPCFAVMQGDGNLCVYPGTDPGTLMAPPSGVR
jgi:hypothetical protein